MRIYSMKATFGKLEHQILTLKPGLNIIEAPNEWGKSTWCAFLICMLYGIDTRSKTTRHQLADKERYLPWSGAPMEGRMDLNWNGKDITIERRTKGRIPLGDFRAYETHTGLEISSLTAENCGQQLLGVEKDVFTRSGFLRFSDLPVTEDEQLRSRLNGLVTTGDESGSAELLEQKLKELKNRCRYNKTGLIPQLRLRKEQLQQQLQQRDTLDQQTRQLQDQVQPLEQKIRELENHRATLRYRAAQGDSVLLRQVQCAREEAQQRLENLRNQVEILPSRDTAMNNLQQLNRLKETLSAIRMEEQMLPSPTEAPQRPQGFEGCAARDALKQARQHREELSRLRPKATFLNAIMMALGGFLLLYSLFLLFFHQPLWSAFCAGTGAVYLILGLIFLGRGKKRLSLYRKRQVELSLLYGCKEPELWVAAAERYARDWENYESHDDGTAQLRELLHSRADKLVAQILSLSQGKGMESALEYWTDILNLWDEYEDARRTYQQTNQQYESLLQRSTQLPVPKEDPLPYTAGETETLLTDATLQLRQLLSRLGQYQGYAEGLPSREALEAEDTALEQRLHQLEMTYAALDLALKSLGEATAQLQRRFAPRISRSAQEILSQLTNGRYNRLTMSQDFSLHAGAQDEDALRSRHWRSDGTVDQLYLALRLAVARELLPDAPLVLDDAMVRFDDLRLKAALEILKQEAQTKQVIVFTCQSREQELLNQ